MTKKTSEKRLASAQRWRDKQKELAATEISVAAAPAPQPADPIYEMVSSTLKKIGGNKMLTPQEVTLLIDTYNTAFNAKANCRTCGRELLAMMTRLKAWHAVKTEELEDK